MFAKVIAAAAIALIVPAVVAFAQRGETRGTHPHSVEYEDLALPELGECSKSASNAEAAIVACSALINYGTRYPGKAFYYRGLAYRRKGDCVSAISDFTKAIEIAPDWPNPHGARALCLADQQNYDAALEEMRQAMRLAPDSWHPYFNRGRVYAQKGDFDKAIADFTESIRRKHDNPHAYARRGSAQSQIGKPEAAILDYTKAIELGEDLKINYTNRAWAYYELGRFSEARSDADKAIAADVSFGNAYTVRGHALLKAGGSDAAALSDFTTALSLGQEEPRPYVGRAMVYEAQSQISRALEDYRKALVLPAKTWMQKILQDKAKERVAAVDATQPAQLPQVRPTPSVEIAQKPMEAEKAMGHGTVTDKVAAGQAEKVAAVQPPATAKPGVPLRRVALVIGNSAYRSVSPLPNPKNDAAAVTEVLTHLGFETITKYDLAAEAMRRTLSEFEDKAAGSDWALVYFAGHGMEADGRNWLIPVDANLARFSDVPDETVALDRVLERVRPAKQLRIVILDACRNNPFISRMIMNRPGRSVARGLAAVEPEHGEVVFYAARDGSVASDGIGKNSPFAAALVKHMDEEGVELGRFFRKVTSSVLSTTNPKQEPFVYGRIPDEDFYFKPPKS
jgi:tetratricopeptide (TPR) repeat protein